MPELTPPDNDLAQLLDRLEVVLDRIEDRLEETARLPLWESDQSLAAPFLSDRPSEPGDLFSMPSFEITTPP
jgi:hypothetical protein